MNRRDLLKYLAALPLIKTIASLTSRIGSVEQKCEDIALDTMFDGYNLGPGTLYFKPPGASAWLELQKVTEFNVTVEVDTVEFVMERQSLGEHLVNVTHTFSGSFEHMEGST